MHYLLFAFCDRDEIEGFMERYDENRKVAPYWVDITIEKAISVPGVAELFVQPGVGPDDPRIIEKITEWFADATGDPVRYNAERGVYQYQTTINPDGIWDYYVEPDEPGGRWEDELGDSFLAKDWDGHIPHDILLANGEWVAKEKWDTVSGSYVANPDFTRILHKEMDKDPNRRVWVIDYHN